jgi:PPK2 family polyphosphate:nucleotide phosphotransferase
VISLDDLPTSAPVDADEEEGKDRLSDVARRIADLQEIMLADAQHSLLVVLQGMDTAGKDGTTQKVFRYCDPSGVSVKGFKKPTEEELAHDFLWRVHKYTPAKGHIQIFNRSHYEDVLVTRVHRLITNEQAHERFEAINAFEKLLTDNQTVVLKFFLNLSFERQEEKLTRRLEDPVKMFKHKSADWEERKQWGRYMDAYQDVLNRSTIPWCAVPADQSWYRNLVVAERVLEGLEGLNLAYPLLETE